MVSRCTGYNSLRIRSALTSIVGKGNQYSWPYGQSLFLRFFQSSVQCSEGHRVVWQRPRIREGNESRELMLDNLQHFVCHSSALDAGQRISALSADEDLELGHVYFLLPMHKLYSSLSPSEIASLVFKVDSALHKSTSNSGSLARILSGLGDLCHRNLVTMNGGDELNEEINGGKGTAETNDIAVPKLLVDDADFLWEVRGLSMRIVRLKYWKPALETIWESPRFSGRINAA